MDAGRDDNTFIKTARYKAASHLAVMLFCAMVIACSIWFFFARIPICVEGEGIAVSVGGVRDTVFNTGIIAQGVPHNRHEVSSGGSLDADIAPDH